jgi:hypothetical protein
MPVATDRSIPDPQEKVLLKVNNIIELPEELLLRIMSNLPGSSLQLLRSTCRLFFRLSEDSKFSDFGAEDADWFEADKLQRYLGLEDKLVVDYLRLPADEREEMKRFIRKDLFCAGCHDMRVRVHQGTNLQQYIECLTTVASAQGGQGRGFRCSVCGIIHPAALFSQKQRMAPTEKRACIGWEGHISLCEHVKIAWADIRKMGRAALQAKGEAGDQLSECEFEARTACSSGCNAAATITFFTNKSASIRGFRCRTNARVTIGLGKTPIRQPEFTHNVTTDTIRDAMITSLPRIRHLLCPHFQSERQGFWPVSLTHLPGKHGEDDMSPLDRFGIRCPICDTGYTYHAEWRSPKKFRLVLRIFSYYAWMVTKPTSCTWIKRLDPQSFGMENDPMFKGITWCDDTTRPCAVSRGRRHLGRLLDKAGTPGIEGNDNIPETFKIKEPGKIDEMSGPGDA